jgi:predicted phage replisome organizer
MTLREDDKMAEVQWIKFYIEMFDKRKIKKLRRLPAGNDILLIWIMLLAMAGKCNAGGMIFITESVPFTEEDLADELDFEVNTIKLALEAFEKLDMVEIKDGGFINILGWEEHQNVDKLEELKEQNRKRVAKCREKKRLQESNVTGNVTGNVTVTQCNDIEEDKEGDKEKESHSFILSAADKEEAKMKYLGGSLGKGVVLLSDEQLDDLLSKLSHDEFNKYIGIVADCELNGKPYKKKTHYQAILDMVAKDRKTKEK